MEPAIQQRSLLATVSEQMIALEKRDWELWLVAAGAGIILGVGLLVLLFKAAFLHHGLLRLNLAVSPEVFCGFVALLILFNTFVMSRRMQLRRTREQLISTTIQSELIHLQGFTDPLTEMYNRRALDDVVRRFVSHARRLKKTLTLMMVDVDRFKEVNSRYGHLIGDFVLAEVATILRGSVRGTDAVVRYGGDEFLVILADSDYQGGQVVVDRTSSLLADWNRAGHLKDFELAFSVGLAEWADGKALDEMLDQADRQMYSTKRSRKNSSGHGSKTSKADQAVQPTPSLKH